MADDPINVCSFILVKQAPQNLWVLSYADFIIFMHIFQKSFAFQWVGVREREV